LSVATGLQLADRHSVPRVFARTPVWQISHSGRPREGAKIVYYCPIHPLDLHPSRGCRDGKRICLELATTCRFGPRLAHSSPDTVRQQTPMRGLAQTLRVCDSADSRCVAQTSTERSAPARPRARRGKPPGAAFPCGEQSGVASGMSGRRQGSARRRNLITVAAARPAQRDDCAPALPRSYS